MRFQSARLQLFSLTTLLHFDNHQDLSRLQTHESTKICHRVRRYPGFHLSHSGPDFGPGKTGSEEKAGFIRKKRGPVEAAFERDYDAPKFKPSWKNEQVNRLMAQDFVIFAHSDLDMTKKLLDREPGLINATLDWGGGDWETALGGASHMGRKDIVKFLLSRGARIDIFCAAMMGQLDAVKAFLQLEPKLIDAKGPHGFTLHFHAQVGGEAAQPVLDHLQSIKKVELRPIPFLQRKKSKKKD